MTRTYLGSCSAQHIYVEDELEIGVDICTPAYLIQMTMGFEQIVALASGLTSDANKLNIPD